MKLYLEDDNGNRIEVQKAAGLQEGDVILFSPCCMNEENLTRMEQDLSSKLNRNVIILDGRFRDIVTLPPIEGAGSDKPKTDSPD